MPFLLLSIKTPLAFLTVSGHKSVTKMAALCNCQQVADKIKHMFVRKILKKIICKDQ